MRKQFAIDTTKIVLSEMLNKSRKPKTEAEMESLVTDYAERLVDLLHLPAIRVAVCDAPIHLKGKCKYNLDSLCKYGKYCDYKQTEP